MSLAAQIDGLDWCGARESLYEDGYACLPGIVSEDNCRRIASLYEDPEARFRSHIQMARYNFGRGEYKYFGYPLPDIVDRLRASFYPHLATIANEWAELLGSAERWPTSLQQLLEICHQANQPRPTPLLLKYTAGDYNCLHQDLYGEIHFPLQVIIQLSPSESYEGGELVLVEQRPRMQSRPVVLRLEQGSAVVVPVRERPVRGARGWRRNQMRHGVSKVLSGNRQTLGLIFHDAA